MSGQRLGQRMSTPVTARATPLRASRRAHRLVVRADKVIDTVGGGPACAQSLVHPRGEPRIRGGATLLQLH